MVKGAAKTAEPTPTPQRLPQMGTGLNTGNMADTIENYHHVRATGGEKTGQALTNSRAWLALTRSRVWESVTCRIPMP